MIYMSIDKRYPYMTMLCKLIDKYFVETLLCSGGVKRVLEVYIGGRELRYITQIVELGYTLTVLKW